MVWYKVQNVGWAKIRYVKNVGKKYCKRGRNFLWHGSLGEKIHSVGWNLICLCKEAGGLGLQPMSKMNKTLLGKWLWHFGVERQRL